MFVLFCNCLDGNFAFFDQSPLIFCFAEFASFFAFEAAPQLCALEGSASLESWAKCEILSDFMLLALDSPVILQPFFRAFLIALLALF